MQRCRNLIAPAGRPRRSTTRCCDRPAGQGDRAPGNAEYRRASRSVKRPGKTGPYKVTEFAQPVARLVVATLRQLLLAPVAEGIWGRGTHFVPLSVASLFGWRGVGRPGLSAGWLLCRR
eukprot:6589365-Alexandrium_andersonii.AAC.1